MATITASRAETRSDVQIQRDVMAELKFEPRVLPNEIGVAVKDGVVTLTGQVTMPYKVNDLARRVSRVDGVRRVDNQIQVLPVSRFDDELRLRIARAIYANPTFWHYASMANPPIHIVVDRGRVRLEGTVNNNVERMLILASGELGEPITADMLPAEAMVTDEATSLGTERMIALPLREAREVFEREYLNAQMLRFSGNISRTAAFIGMERSALHRKLKALGIGETKGEEGDKN